MINDDAFVSAAMADACSMVVLVCFFVKMHLALLEENCLDLVHCAFLHNDKFKLSVCMRNTLRQCYCFVNNN